jgi:hypothetical protein
MARVRLATPPASLSRFRNSSMRPSCMRASPMTGEMMVSSASG